MKILFIVIDGLGDKPIPELGNKTPLEAAKTPNLDWLAKQGICGLIEPGYTTAIPTSEESHFSLFGYSPKKYRIRRGIFTAQGAGIKMRKGDVALRGNFAIVDKNLNIIDRRAGRISRTQPLIKALDGMIIDNVYPVKSARGGAAKPQFNRVKFLIKSAGQHRLGIVLRGKNLSPEISDNDPHYATLGRKAKKILPAFQRAQFTAKVLNKFLTKARQILEKKASRANYILVRGASSLQKVPNFKQKYKLKAACIAGKLLYKQIGNFLGMDLIKVRGATGLSNTNLKAKFLAAKKSLEKYDFVFLHIKATDKLAEDGNFLGKKKFIERIDQNLKHLLYAPKHRVKTLLVVTADHSTCCRLKRHCSEPVPVLIFGNGQDKVNQFSERACKKGKLGKMKALDLMPKILKIRIMNYEL